MNRTFLFSSLLFISSTAMAQTPNCTALVAENKALTDKVAAYEARLGIGVGGATVENADEALKFKFVSCKLSKASHKAKLVVIVTNSGEPIKMVLSGPGSSNFGSVATLVVDESGTAYNSDDLAPTVGGKTDGASTIPTNVPVSCTVTLSGVPASVTRLNSATLVYYKTGADNERKLLKSTVKNIPVTLVP